MSYKNIALTGMFVGLVTYSSITYGIHHKEVVNDLGKSHVLREEIIQVCAKNECFTLEKDKPMPKGYVSNPPLGKDYVFKSREVRCLAQQLFQEPVKGNDLDRLAVGWATINRVKHSQYPDTICKVVGQSRGKSYDMSWYGDLSKRNMPPTKADIKLARDILLGNTKNPIGNARHWCNNKLDSPNAFGCKESRKTENIGFKIQNTPHTFVEVTREGL